MTPFSLRSRLLWLVCVAVLGGAHPASAATLTYASGFGLWPGNFYSDAPFAQCTKNYGASAPCQSSASAQGTVDLQRFDPALGVLTAVTLSLDSTLALGVEVFGNRDGGTSTVTGYAQYAVGPWLAGTTPTLSITCANFCNEFTSGGLQSVDADGQTAVPGADLLSFVGSTPMSLTFIETVFTSGSASFADIGVIARTRTTELFTGPAWQGTLSVTYEYTPAPAPVPEPSALALGLLALAAGTTRRRRLRRIVGLTGRDTPARLHDGRSH